MWSRGLGIGLVSLVLMAGSSVLLYRDLIQIHNSAGHASGADIWYEGQLNRDLLRLELAVKDYRLRPGPEAADKILLHLDFVYNRLNTLPVPENEWHTQGIARLPEIGELRVILDHIDQALKRQDESPGTFIEAVERELGDAIRVGTRVSMKVVEHQNSAIGSMQALFDVFRAKLMGYAAGFIVVLLGLLYLMSSYVRSESALRESNEQLRASTRELTAARDEAVRANAAKANFLAVISHELRTPLNVIIGFAEVLKDKARLAEDARREYATDIHGAAVHLLSLINDILDLSKLEAARFKLIEEPADICRLIQRSVRSMQKSAEMAGLAIHVDVPASPVSVQMDERRLRQVLDNILANSIKFTEPGGRIDVHLTREPSGDLRISVKDTGMGIAPGDIERVFKPFEQVEGAMRRHHGGSGLGLPLVKQLTERHGGTVQLISQLGEGTEMILTLPASRVLERTASGVGA